MSNLEELTFEVKAKMHVPKVTADACLAIVNLYLDYHRDKKIESVKNEDGTTEFRIV